MSKPSTERPHAREHGAGPPEPLNRFDDTGAQERIAFLLVPGFTHLGFSSAIEPLRMANMVTGRPDYAAVTVTIDGEAVMASNGVRTLPDYAIDGLPAMRACSCAGPIRSATRMSAACASGCSRGRTGES